MNIAEAGPWVDQAPEGDYRGIYGNQPAHTYTSALMEVLIQAGYRGHPSIERAFHWLLDTRQDDGGWAIPARTSGKNAVKDWRKWASSPPVEADRSKPSLSTHLGGSDSPQTTPISMAPSLGFAESKSPHGSFDLSMRRGLSDRRLPYRLGLAICRALMRFERSDKNRR